MRDAHAEATGHRRAGRPVPATVAGLERSYWRITRLKALRAAEIRRQWAAFAAPVIREDDRTDRWYDDPDHPGWGGPVCAPPGWDAARAVEAADAAAIGWAPGRTVAA
jgi:hypothetical protein